MLSKFKHNFKIFKKINYFKNSLLKIKSNKLNSLIKNIKFNKQKILTKIKLNNHKFIFNKKKIKLYTSYDRILLLLVGVVFLIISYLSIPFFYESNKLIDKVKNELFKNLNINFNLTEDFSYSFFPRPILTFQKVSFLDQVDDLGEMKVNISPRNLFFLKKINIGDVTLKNINLNINKKNYNFFTELLKNDYSNFKFEIKNSNIFYRNIKNDVLFINKVKKLEYYYDEKKSSNFLIANNEIFNIPYNIKYKNNFNKRKIETLINSDLLKIKIKNQFSYMNPINEGVINFFYDKKKSKAKYSLNKNFFKFTYSEELLEPNFIYNGNINFKPFFSEFSGNLKEINSNQLFNPNSILVQFLKTEILNNKNLNIKTSVNANQIKFYKDLINFALKIKISEGLIDINETSLSWLDDIHFKISDSLIYMKDNNLFLDAFITININDYNKVYKFFQTPRNYRKQIKKIEFNLNYNFDQFTVKLDDIKIDDLINEDVNKNLNLLILKDNKLQNRIYLKSLMNQAIKNYAG